MRKYSSDVSVSINCIDANLEMVERRDPDNFPRFPPQEWCAWTIPEIALNMQEIDSDTTEQNGTFTSRVPLSPRS